MAIKQIDELLPAEAPVETPVETTDQPMQVAGGGLLKALLRKPDPPSPDFPKGKPVSVAETQARVGALTSDEVNHVMETSVISKFVDPARNENRNFGLAAIDSADDVKGFIEGTAEIIMRDPPARFETVPHAKTWEDAILNGPTVEEMLGYRPGQIWNATEMTRARMLMVMGAEEIMQYARTLSAHGKMKASLTDDEMWVLRKMLTNYAGIQRAVMGASAEAGRVLNSMKIHVGPNDVMLQSVKEQVQNMGGESVTMRQLQMILESGGDPSKIAKVARESWQTKTWNMLMEIWINGLLSAPSTHSVNIVGNLLNTGLAVGERYLAAGVGTIRSAGGLRKIDRVTWTEANATAFGWLQGWRFGWIALREGMLKGEDYHGGGAFMDPQAMKASNLSRRPAVTAENMGINENSWHGRAIDIVGQYYIRLPGKMLQVEDDFFKAFGYVMELNALSVRQAQKEGLTQGSPEFNARIAELIKDPPFELNANAYQFSRVQTFTNDLTDQISQKALEISRLPVGKLFLPFVRTPTNILKYGMIRSPLGFVMPSFYRDVAAGGAKRDLAIARISYGSAGAIGLWAMMSGSRGLDNEGNEVYRPLITGAGPKNWSMKKQWATSGIKPYSIYLDLGDGHKYYQFNRYEPFGFMLGNIANTFEIYNNTYDEGTREQIASAIVLGMADYVGDKSYMTGFAQLMDLFDSQGGTGSHVGKLERWSAKWGASFVPNWLSKVTQDIEVQFGEGMRRDPRGGDWLHEFLNRAQMRIPWLSENVPQRVNMIGDHMPFNDPIWYLHSISPSSATIASDNPEIWKELLAAGIPDRTPSESTVRLSGLDGMGRDMRYEVDMMKMDPTGWMFHDFKMAVGERRKSAMYALFNSVGWTALDQDGKSMLLNKALADSLKDVKQEIFTNVDNISARGLAYDFRQKYRDEVLETKGISKYTKEMEPVDTFTLPPHLTQEVKF